MSGDSFTRRAQEEIRRAMREANITQERAAAEIGTSQSAVSRILCSDSVKTAQLERLAEIVDLDLYVLGSRRGAL